MFKTIFKKKITESALANALINTIGDSVSNGFPEVAEIINSSKAFEVYPNIQKDNDEHFFRIVVAANIVFMRQNLPNSQAVNVERLIFEKLAKVYDIEILKMRNVIEENISLMNRLNAPAKNFISSLPKAIFFKYNLNEYQDQYFKRLNTPNPLFLKQMDETLKNFIWDWDLFEDKYKVI
jgi:hypothetical protein